MSSAITFHANDLRLSSFANKTLELSASLWFLTTVFGQWFFAYYIMVFYGGNALQGNWTAWSNRMIHGIVEGDVVGNIAVLIHIFLAFVITFCGPLQLVPQMRTRFPSFHHWNGRTYILTAFVISAVGIYMTWSREAVIGGLIGQISISIDAVLIMLFAVLALRTAMARRINDHRRWALRLFLVVAGVWFYRIGRGLWMFLNDGSSTGVNNTLTGPFDITLGFAGYLLPLFFLELYFYAKTRGGQRVQFAMSGLMLLLSVATAIGIYQAAYMFWIPNL